MSFQAGIPDLKKAMKGDAKKYTLAIIDGNNMLFRAFLGYGNNAAITRPGVYGTFKFLLDLLDTLHKKCAICVVWDTGHDRKRVSLYPEYKQKASKDQKISKELIKDDLITVQNMFRKLPIITAWNPDKPTEGDDIIYSICKLWKEGNNGKVLILSGDGDMIQLVNENTSLFSPMSKAFYCEENVDKVLGFPRDRFILYKSLMGDMGSDNITGVPGIGEETALKLVREYPTLEAIVSNPEVFADKTKRVGSKVFKVCEHRDIVKRNLQLIQLKEVVYTMPDDGEPRIEEVAMLLSDMGYTTFHVPLRMGFSGRF